MADPMTGPAPRCQWCSAPLPAPDLPTCPSCGATLTSTATEEIRGVTTLDPEAILRARAEVSRPRSRLMSFITGEAPVEVGGEAEQAAIAAPDDAVRREMRRLQLEAERADLEAETVAMKTDVVLEQGIDLAALADADDAADAPTTTADAPPAPPPADEPAPPPSAPPPPPSA
ncbi:MAG TPA: hypothetical protein VFY23_04570 [Candidatus Limnocylindrales bacterium]|nr:hypothetical protein [Candidatus Limnocylindrales bacterium]